MRAAVGVQVVADDQAAVETGQPVARPPAPRRAGRRRPLGVGCPARPGTSSRPAASCAVAQHALPDRRRRAGRRPRPSRPSAAAAERTHLRAGAQHRRRSDLRAAATRGAPRPRGPRRPRVGSRTPARSQASSCASRSAPVRRSPAVRQHQLGQRLAVPRTSRVSRVRAAGASASDASGRSPVVAGHDHAAAYGVQAGVGDRVPGRGAGSPASTSRRKCSRYRRARPSPARPRRRRPGRRPAARRPPPSRATDVVLRSPVSSAGKETPWVLTASRTATGACTAPRAPRSRRR